MWIAFFLFNIKDLEQNVRNVNLNRFSDPTDLRVTSWYWAGYGDTEQCEECGVLCCGLTTPHHTTLSVVVGLQTG